MENEVRFQVETKKTQIARRPKVGKDGALVVYVTKRHYRVFMYIASRILGKPTYTPSYQEVADSCGYKNRDSAYRAVLAIAEHGLLTTDIGRTRSIQVTEQGEAVFHQWKAAEEKRKPK